MTLFVNGEKIEDWQVQQEVERLRPSYEKTFADMPDKERQAQLLDWSRENVIEKVLINQQAQNNSEQIPKAKVETAFNEIKNNCGGSEQLHKEFGTDNENEIKEHIELHMKVERLLQDVYKDIPEPSQEDILKFYEKNKEQFKSAEQVRVAHIVKHINGFTDEAAAFNAIRKAHDELTKGAVFEKLVTKYSDCPDNGGDLGYITRGQMVEEFEDVVFNLGANEVSGVFQSRFGFHIAKIYDRKSPVLRALEEVQDCIVNELREQRQRKAINEFIDRLKSKAKIEEI
ncbi:MAG: peptidylprolyl isomerase [Planctomycetota bacterium]